MRTVLKSSIIVVVFAALAGGSYGAWYAWDNGVIGKNPRAPTAQAMEQATRKQAIFNINALEASVPCINLELSNPRPEISGIPGITLAAVPGRHSITLLRQALTRMQPARDIQIEQLDYLTSQGFFTATDVAVETELGMQPARNYQLTWEGYANTRQNYGSVLCFDYGHREFERIEHIEKLLEKVIDMEVYEVTYSIKQHNPPAWIQGADAKRWFPKLAELTEDSKRHAKVIRTKDGWRSANEIEIEVAQATKNQAGNNPYMQEMLKNLTRQPPSLEDIRQLIAAQSTDINWASRNSIACLQLQLQRGDDDRPKPGTAGHQDTSALFSVTYYDRPDRKANEHRVMIKSLHILSALEHAGLAKMERISPAPRSKKKNVRTPALLSADEQNGGIRYVVTREVAEALGISSYGGGCIPSGRIRTELLGIQSNRGMTQIRAHGLLEQTPDWVAKISEGLPALKNMLEYGIPMNGQVSFTTVNGEGKWRLQSLSPVYPDMNYSDLPPHIAPLMPLTVAAFPPKSVMSHASIISSAIAPSSLTANTSPATQQPTPQSPVRMPSANTPAPYPAHDASVHVISIYQGVQKNGGQRGFGEHPESITKVKVSEDNAILLLLSYEPIEWHIEADRGVKLNQVIAIGHYEPRVTFSGGGKPQVIVTRRAEMKSRMGIDLKVGFVTRNEANDLIDIATTTRTITDTLPKTFQVSYEAPVFGFTIGPQTAAFALPTPQKPKSDGTPITLRSSFSESVQGNRLFRGRSGAYTDAWSDSAYSAGKLYYEGTMKVTGSLTAHTHANIGLCLERGIGIESSTPGGSTVISHGAQKLYKDGDVFGIAADFDQNRLYFRVNGKWLSGTPESGNGFPLQPGKQYRACVLAAGTVTGEVAQGMPQSDTAWDANFGERAFHTPLPSGYTAFNGSNKN